MKPAASLPAPHVRFKDLLVGDRFEFATPALHGPWVKTGWRYYVPVDGPPQQIAVGTILVKVVRMK